MWSLASCGVMETYVKFSPKVRKHTSEFGGTFSIRVFCEYGFKSDHFISSTTLTPIKFPNTDLIEHKCLHCSYVASVINTSGYVHTAGLYRFPVHIIFVSDYTVVW